MRASENGGNPIDTAIVPQKAAALATPEAIDTQVKEYIQHAKAANTAKAYRADWQDFVNWCAAYGVSALPATAETLARYLTARARTMKVSTLQRHLSAISQAHTAKGFPRFSVLDEPLKSVWAGIRRVHGVAQQGKVPVQRRTSRPWWRSCRSRCWVSETGRSSSSGLPERSGGQNWWV